MLFRSPTASNSAYLGTYNRFLNGSSFSGSSLCAYDRAAMLSGGNATQICLETSLPSFLPADVDGATPPTEAPVFVDLQNTGSLFLYQMNNLDFANPGAASLSGYSIPVASFSYACSGGACIPQPGTTKLLDALGGRLMYRLAYRVFGDHVSMVVNHSVTAEIGRAHV